MLTQKLYEEKDLLIREIQKGDINAFNVFFNEFYAPLNHYCRHLVIDEEEAKDIVLQTFYKIWERREKIQNYLNAKSFLYLVARNAGLNYLKQSKRRVSKFNEFSLSVELIEDEENYLAIEAEILHQLKQEIKKLPTKCRRIFELSYIDGKSIAEVAELLQISSSNVTSQRSRAIQILRLALSNSPLLLAFLMIICRSR